MEEQYVKGVVPLSTSERAVPMTVKMINLEQREMPGVTNMTKGIERTHPELSKIEKHVPTIDTKKTSSS